MTSNKRWPLILMLSVFSLSTSTFGGAPTPQALALIDELGLTEADTPITELKGKTLLVVGLGGIGTEIAWRAQGLGMRVIATRSSSRDGPDFVEYVGLVDMQKGY